jgi:hypothetical protein
MGRAGERCGGSGKALATCCRACVPASSAQPAPRGPTPPRQGLERLTSFRSLADTTSVSYRGKAIEVWAASDASAVIEHTKKWVGLGAPGGGQGARAGAGHGR